MIFRPSESSGVEEIGRLQRWLVAQGADHKRVDLDGTPLLVTSAAFTLEPPSALLAGCEVLDPGTEYQLCTRHFRPNQTVIDLGAGVVFGDRATVMLAGPCAVESEAQLMQAAEFLRHRCGLRVFRAGAYKPRTSTYSFQGMGEAGLRLLERVRDAFGLKIITEVKDTTHLRQVAEVADIVQVGAKSMFNTTLLARCGTLGKPVMLKRGFMATIKELLQAADVVMSHGNSQVILCERGIRTFEHQTRFCLDVCAAALIQSVSHLPLVLDPSHAAGVAGIVPAVARAAAGLGVDGIMVETHPDPAQARCDRDQALELEQYQRMLPTLRAICEATGRELVG